MNEVITLPDYETFEDDQARRTYLQMLILNTKKRHMNGIRVDARGLEFEKEKKVQERLDRMAGGSAKPVVRNFKL